MNEKNIFRPEPEREIKEFRQIPLAEIKKMVEINKMLDDLSRQDNELRKPYLPVPEYREVNERFNKLCDTVERGEPRRLLRIDIEKQIYGDLENITQDVINQAIEYLDNLDIWRYKFKTEKPRPNTKVPPKPNEQDSIYYVTDSGLSLRLKLAKIREGFSKVRQPIFEKIFFVNKKGQEADWEVDDIPHIGWHVEESSSKRFTELLKRENPNTDFLSEVKLIERDGKKIASYGDVPHEGDAVKEIIFDRT